MPNIKLFCFPFAGGAVSSFLSWKPLLAPEIELSGLELAGRGKRMGDPLYQTMDQAVNDVYQRIVPETVGRPYMFFGHSMGAVIAYELACKLKASGRNGPIHIFLSGARAPHLHGEEKAVYHLDDAGFKQKIIGLGGTSADVFKYPELERIYLPILRADFTIDNTYRYRPHDKLDCDITVIYGDREFVPDTDIGAWRDYTAGNCRIVPFPGGHFFINEYKEAVVTMINESVRE